MTKPQISGLSNFNSSRTSVLSEDIQFDAGVSHLAMPLFGSDTGNISVSLKGKSRITNISGVYTGTESEINNFRIELETESNKNIQPSKDYTPSDGGATYKVLIMNFTIRRDLISESQATFSIDLITSTQLLS